MESGHGAIWRLVENYGAGHWLNYTNLFGLIMYSFCHISADHDQFMTTTDVCVFSQCSTEIWSRNAEVQKRTRSGNRSGHSCLCDFK